MKDLSREHEVDLPEMTLFYYNVYEYQWNDKLGK